MASFCAQCSIYMWGHDDQDWAGRTTVEQTRAGLVTTVICEGCGITDVDHLGFCVAPDCIERHAVSFEMRYFGA